MGPYKICEHSRRDRERCEHPWWGSFRGLRVSLSKWANREIHSKAEAWMALDELRKAIRAALEMGIARQGATLRDYRDPEGRRGRMQDEFKVYGRAGEPCPRCGAPIEKTRAGGRGTWYCPQCQPLDPG